MFFNDPNKSAYVCVTSISAASPPRILMLSLQHLADEGEDEEREYRAPDEGVDDHQHPPNETAGRRAKGVGDDVARLPKESLEYQETDEMHHAQRHIGKQE